MRRYPALLLFALVGCDRAAPPSHSALADSLDAVSRSFAEQHHLVGLAVGVMDRDSVIFRAGFGTTSIPNGKPVTPQTVFHMASISKTFVATAIMQLVEQGSIALDSSVRRYLPDFSMKDPRAASITIRQLLTHTAGMPDVTDYRWNAPEADDAALHRYVLGLADSTLIAAPGAGWRYSNIGFEVLADVVATVARMPFEDYVQRRILTPLGMRKSTFLMTDVDTTLLAQGNEADSTGAPKPTGVYPYNRPHAGSSTLHSNVDDMLLFGAANIHRGALGGASILSPATYAEMWKPQADLTATIAAMAREASRTLPYSKVAIGLSWFLPEYHGHRLAFHSGGDVGFSTDLVLAPDDNVVIAVMTNESGVRMWDLSVRLLDLVLAARGAR